MKRNSILAAALMFAMSTAASFAQGTTWTIDPAHTQASFQVRHLSVSNVRGSISNVTGTVVWDSQDSSKDSVVAQLDVTTVNTSNDARDKAIKSAEFFNVAKYPTMTFKSTSVQRTGASYKVVGDLTLAGVTKEVVLNVDGPASPQKGMRGGRVTGLSASTHIKRTDFNIGNKYPDAMLSDDITIEIDLEMGQK